MRVLVIGGSGYVGTLTLPLLAEQFTLRVFDRNPPSDPRWEYLQGDITDPAALDRAAEGAHLLLYMAMGTVRGLSGIHEPIPAYDVNVKGVHLALGAAVKAGIKRAVYTSSLSVYDDHLDIRSGVTDREGIPPEPHSLYGFTKLLGEEVCAFFARAHNLPTLALRLFMPVSQEKWHAEHDPTQVDGRTSAPDLARAFAAALDYDHTGFDVIHITGDTSGRAYHHEKAKRLLGWEPMERP